MDDILQSILYGHLSVDIKNLTFQEQLEVLRAVVANSSALSRLKIAADLHPFVEELLARMRAARTEQQQLQLQEQPVRAEGGVRGNDQAQPSLETGSAHVPPQRVEPLSFGSLLQTRPADSKSESPAS
jgi:hypothetical protein